MRSGYINISAQLGTLRYLNNNGYLLPSTAAEYTSELSATSYVFYISPEQTHPSSTPTGRWGGRPLRCLKPLSTEILES